MQHAIWAAALTKSPLYILVEHSASTLQVGYGILVLPLVQGLQEWSFRQVDNVLILHTSSKAFPPCHRPTDLAFQLALQLGLVVCNQKALPMYLHSKNWQVFSCFQRSLSSIHTTGSSSFRRRANQTAAALMVLPDVPLRS